MAGASEAGGRSDVVTRARVVRSWWLDPVEVGPHRVLVAHRTELEVTDPVLGAEVGDRLVVFDRDVLRRYRGARGDQRSAVSPRSRWATT